MLGLAPAFVGSRSGMCRRNGRGGRLPSHGAVRKHGEDRIDQRHGHHDNAQGDERIPRKLLLRPCSSPFDSGALKTRGRHPHNLLKGNPPPALLVYPVPEPWRGKALLFPSSRPRRQGETIAPGGSRAVPLPPEALPFTRFRSPSADCPPGGRCP